MEAATITNHQLSLVRLASVKQQSWPDTDRVKEIAESSEGVLIQRKSWPEIKSECVSAMSSRGHVCVFLFFSFFFLLINIYESSSLLASSIFESVVEHRQAKSPFTKKSVSTLWRHSIMAIMLQARQSSPPGVSHISSGLFITDNG